MPGAENVLPGVNAQLSSGRSQNTFCPALPPRPLVLLACLSCFATHSSHFFAFTPAHTYLCLYIHTLLKIQVFRASTPIAGHNLRPPRTKSPWSTPLSLRPIAVPRVSPTNILSPDERDCISPASTPHCRGRLRSAHIVDTARLFV